MKSEAPENRHLRRHKEDVEIPHVNVSQRRGVMAEDVEEKPFQVTIAAITIREPISETRIRVEAKLDQARREPSSEVSKFGQASSNEGSHPGVPPTARLSIGLLLGHLVAIVVVIARFVVVDQERQPRLANRVRRGGHAFELTAHQLAPRYVTDRQEAHRRGHAGPDE